MWVCAPRPRSSAWRNLTAATTRRPGDGPRSSHSLWARWASSAGRHPSSAGSESQPLSRSGSTLCSVFSQRCDRIRPGEPSSRSSAECSTWPSRRGPARDSTTLLNGAIGGVLAGTVVVPLIGLWNLLDSPTPAPNPFQGRLARRAGRVRERDGDPDGDRHRSGDRVLCSRVISFLSCARRCRARSARCGARAHREQGCARPRCSWRRGSLSSSTRAGEGSQRCHLLSYPSPCSRVSWRRGRRRPMRERRSGG